METKVVTAPERTQAVLPSREAVVPAPQAEAAAKLENAGNLYWSPIVRIDNETHSAVLQYLDPKTGEVVRSFPHELGRKAYADAEHQLRNEKAKTEEAKPVEAKPAPVRTEHVAAKPSGSSSGLTGKSVVA